MQGHLTCLLAAGLACLPRVAAGEPNLYAIDAARSVVTIEVGKTGALSFMAGHTHEVMGPVESGAVTLDLDDIAHAHVALAIGSAALNVTGKGESAGDVPKVQQAMDSDQVLAVARYPQILFESAAVTLSKRQASSLALTVTGQLTIRDAARPVSVPVSIVLDGQTLTATGHFQIKQTTFGIQPISVAGVVKVKDELDLQFSIVATRQ